eukprot:CAMPEP_0177162896 /NCGR_PEP_ID=MMETSP0367-20130122/6124_1 /TAXON_ID=447022 ORGANISM="Scrippsiella hangoei-like, Strain SHHI-4" /NCGR_SAMPLE_ID=MMETSP0367 /ASSEMBLY_ACC=CAM_ASM_000362 /LENGTH=132 /DNA_ID=CAMNT_0018608687 /DNA_START=1510 /DNA_END=1908 /DNA_ORIENTATION=-
MYMPAALCTSKYAVKSHRLPKFGAKRQLSRPTACTVAVLRGVAEGAWAVLCQPCIAVTSGTATSVLYESGTCTCQRRFAPPNMPSNVLVCPSLAPSGSFPDLQPALWLSCGEWQQATAANVKHHAARISNMA